eukprot:m.16891 g.16891  ORF g.16891 m.16891 type:complete len:466 (-) comp11079_c0_seq2:296-1693(-)
MRDSSTRHLALSDTHSQNVFIPSPSPIGQIRSRTHMESVRNTLEDGSVHQLVRVLNLALNVALPECCSKTLVNRCKPETRLSALVTLPRLSDNACFVGWLSRWQQYCSELGPMETRSSPSSPLYRFYDTLGLPAFDTKLIKNEGSRLMRGMVREWHESSTCEMNWNNHSDNDVVPWAAKRSPLATNVGTAVSFLIRNVPRVIADILYMVLPLWLLVTATAIMLLVAAIYISVNHENDKKGAGITAVGMVLWLVLLSCSSQSMDLTQEPEHCWTAPNATKNIDVVVFVTKFYTENDVTTYQQLTKVLMALRETTTAERTGLVVAVTNISECTKATRLACHRWFADAIDASRSEVVLLDGSTLPPEYTATDAGPGSISRDVLVEEAKDTGVFLSPDRLLSLFRHIKARLPHGGAPNAPAHLRIWVLVLLALVIGGWRIQGVLTPHLRPAFTRCRVWCESVALLTVCM